MATKFITTPVDENILKNLHIGDQVFINGIIYTARDAAHKRMIDLINSGKTLPVELQNQAIYYVGPTPTKPGEVIGSAGPTTSYRMDAYAPILLRQAGLKMMIGKGQRNQDVRDAMVKYRAVYLGAIGGAAALISKSIKKAEVVAYPDLGPEAIHKLTVENFPTVVINDIYGNDLYDQGRKRYAADKYIMKGK